MTVQVKTSPFLFGQVVDSSHFVNRTAELALFKTELASGIHQIIISPRRWGKSSFVKQASLAFKNSSNIVFCFIDLFSIRSESEFFETISRRVFKATQNTLEEASATLKNYMGSLLPRLTLSPDPAQSFDIDFTWQKKPEHIEEILNLPEKIARKKKIRIVMCFDEFQNIADFSDSKPFQKLLRSYWQNHKHVTYCLYGSKRSMMAEMFEKQNMPFYRFGNSIYLQKISEPELTAYVVKRFKSTGKEISPELAGKLVLTMERHPYYVQQLAHFLWLNTADKASEKQWKQAVENLFSQNLILYQKDFESLSVQQLKLLKALCSGESLRLTAGETIKKYDLGTSATVLRSLEAMEKKEIIDRFTSETEFIDPGFKLWLKTKIFNSN